MGKGKAGIWGFNITVKVADAQNFKDNLINYLKRLEMSEEDLSSIELETFKKTKWEQSLPVQKKK